MLVVEIRNPAGDDENRRLPGFIFIFPLGQNTPSTKRKREYNKNGDVYEDRFLK